ncbi:hypothetical protein [Vibrio vulnificus]|uniref:hypothetical protein n=1 Tax=Vibrio vulnificus TaxID=672 RepID=UPI0009B6AC08|nr:hypothetical protein [Vibrio vulnificus]OQK49097.1 hypothetical protein XM76_c20975 [Vibrio vulnificus]
MSVDQFKKSVFDAIQLDNVIWVDDRFSPTNQSIVSDYLQHVEATAESALHLISDFENFVSCGIDMTLPFETWKESIPINDETISDYYQYVGVDQPDFTTTEFNELISIFEDHSIGNINKLSLADWQSQKGKWLSQNSRNLFLIDYNFEHEGQSSTFGKDIIEEILRNSHLSDIYCVLFTSEAKHGKEEEEKRNKIINEMDSKLKSYNFSVLSKSIITSENEDVCIKFKTSEFIKRIFLRKLSAEMVDSISDSLIDSINELKNDLSQHSIYEVDRSVFTSSLSEGSSEFELLHRLFSIKQSQSINKLLSKSNLLTEKLCHFRSVQSVSFVDKTHTQYLEKIIPANNKFSKLRLEEIFDNSINNIHSPLSSGDIFEFGEKKYVLIEQACDLSVRGKDGKRKLSEAILIPFEERNIKKSSLESKQALDKFYALKIPNHTSNNFYCLFDFSEAVTVNINWLDLCVFNPDGRLKMSHSSNPPKLVHLPGWRIKFSSINSKLSSALVHSHYQPSVSVQTKRLNGDYNALKDTFGIFSFTKTPYFKISISPNHIHMKGRRVKRLRESFMENLSRAYFIGYKTRGALGNDFSN